MLSGFPLSKQTCRGVFQDEAGSNPACAFVVEKIYLFYFFLLTPVVFTVRVLHRPTGELRNLFPPSIICESHPTSCAHPLQAETFYFEKNFYSSIGRAVGYINVCGFKPHWKFRTTIRVVRFSLIVLLRQRTFH